MNQPPAPKRASAVKWLLRIFLGCFLISVAAPVAIAVAVLHISGDTRALRNAAVHGDSAHWKKRIEMNVGSLPFLATRLALPFIDINEDAKVAISAVRGVEFSVHELMDSEPDRARVFADADASMSKRGWDRVVAVIDRDTAVSVYTQGNGASDLKISVLVLNGRQMVAATGHGNFQGLFELAMRKADDSGFFDRRFRQ